MTICHLYDLGIWRHYSHSLTWKFQRGSESKQDCPADETAHSWAAVVMVLFLWAKQLVFNRLPSLRQLTSTDAAGCVKTSFASKQLVFVFHLNFPRLVPFCRRWVQLPAGRHVNMCLTQVWRRVQFTFTFFSIIQLEAHIFVSHSTLTQVSIHSHFLFNPSSLLGWKQANKKQFDEKGDAGDLGMIYEGRLGAFLAGCLHQSPSLDHLFWLFSELTLSYGNYIFPPNYEKGELCSQSIIKASGLQE